MNPFKIDKKSFRMNQFEKSFRIARMNKFKIIWTSDLTRKQKIEKYFALIVSKGVWGLHLLALKPSDFAHMECIHTRCIRRILGIRAAYYSCISNAEVLRQAQVEGMQAFIRRKQLSLLGHILRRESSHPDSLVCFEAKTALEPRLPAGTHRRRGRPRLTLADTILPLFHRYLQVASRQQ